MDQYEYFAAPFRATIIANKQGPEAASEQLNQFIRHYQAQGWEFDSIAAIHMLIQPGCLASLFGASSSLAAYDQVIFKRRRA